MYLEELPVMNLLQRYKQLMLDSTLSTYFSLFNGSDKRILDAERMYDELVRRLQAMGLEACNPYEAIPDAELLKLYHDKKYFPGEEEYVYEELARRMLKES